MQNAAVLSRFPETGIWTDHITPGNHKTEEQHRHEICVVGRWLYEQGLVPSTDGNLSVRLSNNRILTTPAGTCKGRLDPSDIVVTDPDGQRLQGRCEPSTELGMHLLIYSLRPDVNAICHAHPPIATGFAAAGVSLEKPLVAEMVVNLGPVPLAPYAQPGTTELRMALEPFVEHHDAILMANHGVVTYGSDLLTAFRRMESVEHFARITLVTDLLGKQCLLSSRDVEKLLAGHPRQKI